MTKREPIDSAALVKQAQVSEDKEAYIQLEKTKNFRIGMGAREKPPTPSFFIEVIINLSPENRTVDLQRLENILVCLKTLKFREYKSYFEDNNCILCEKTIDTENPNEEYEATKALMQELHL